MPVVDPPEEDSPVGDDDDAYLLSDEELDELDECQDDILSDEDEEDIDEDEVS